MKADLLTRIRDDAALTALIGARSYWRLRPPSGAMPALTMRRITAGRDYVHDGASALEHPMVQIDIYAATDEVATQIETALKALLEPEATVGGTRFVRAFLEDARDPDIETLADGTIAVRIGLDFIIWNAPTS